MKLAYSSSPNPLVTFTNGQQCTRIRRTGAVPAPFKVAPPVLHTPNPLYHNHQRSTIRSMEYGTVPAPFKVLHSVILLILYMTIRIRVNNSQEWRTGTVPVLHSCELLTVPDPVYQRIRSMVNNGVTLNGELGTVPVLHSK